MMPFARAGVLVGQGAATADDLDLIRMGRLEALKLRALVNPPSDLAAYRDVGVHTFLVQLLSPDTGQQPVTPQTFIDTFAPAVEAYVREGVRDFEVHGEPNRSERGYGVSWYSPELFGEWFVAVAEGLRQAFGPQVRVGFPGLTPPLPHPAGHEPAISEDRFLSACAEAIKQADFVCCHIYWQDADGLRAVDGGLRFLTRYLRAFPKLPLIISEFATVNPGVGGAEKGWQYAEFYLTCAQYDACHYDWPWQEAYWPRVQAAYGMLLRSVDPAYDMYAWMGANGRPGALIEKVAARDRLPHPATMRLVWPTEFQHYTQFYGENQEHYYQTSYANSLHGGHNGVDLQVRYDDPASSPIRACLAGRVLRKRMLNTGYGHHVIIESQVVGVGQVTLLYGHMTDITVEEQQMIEAGQVIGSAGSTGASTGPHLHLSLKVEGMDLPANANHLNARAYLDPLPPARGQPREMYARTYVLLPPQAGADWARAVVAAGWGQYRFTIGGSADDAGIGNLDFRRVVAVNPSAWDDDLQDFFAHYYPGVIYVPVEAVQPEDLSAALDDLPPLPDQSPAPPQAPSRGRPRDMYERTYVLLPPQAGAAWAEAVVGAAWDAKRFTIGGSADDAGIGDLDYRRVIAVNPAEWGDDLWAFFEAHYPGALYVPLEAETPLALIQKLSKF